MPTKTVATKTVSVRKAVVKPPPRQVMPSTPPRVAVSRPWLLINGVQRGAVDANLVACSVRHVLNQPAELTLEINLFAALAALGDAAGQLWHWLDIGKSLQLSLGPYADVQVFSGLVMSLGLSQADGRPVVLRVVAMDALQSVQATLRQRSLPAATTAQRVASLAAEQGLSTDLQWPGPVQPEQVQLGESNLALLQRWAVADGIGFWLDDRTLRARPLDAAGPPAHRLVTGNSLRSFDLAADVRTQNTTVLAGGWLVPTAQAAAELVRPDAGAGGQGGPEALAYGLGERTRPLTDLAAAAAADARHTAQQALAASSRQYLQGCATAIGPLTEPAPLLPGGRIDLQGLGPRFSGAYQVVALSRRFDLANGLSTELELQRDTLGRF